MARGSAWTTCDVAARRPRAGARPGARRDRRVGRGPRSVRPPYSRPVPEIVPLRVQVIARTQFEPPAEVPWETDATGGQALAEFAGRACYQSWNKPNPATATNAGYLRHILEVGHLSVLEHGTRDVLPHRRVPVAHPRADPAPALLLRQLSQRYVPGARRRDGGAGR